MAKLPKRGEICRLDLNPVRGKDLAGKRFVYVLSPADENLAIVLPIGTGITLARNQGFAVTLMGAGTKTTGRHLQSTAHRGAAETRREADRDHAGGCHAGSAAAHRAAGDLKRPTWAGWIFSTRGTPMSALHILAENGIEVLVDLVAAAKTSEIERHIVPKTVVKGDRFLLFDHDSLTFAAYGEFASDAEPDPKYPKYYLAALQFYSIFDDGIVISQAQVVEAHPTWVTDFPKWKWIQQAAQGFRSSRAQSAKVPDAVSEELWELVCGVASGKSSLRSGVSGRRHEESSTDDVQCFYNDVSISLQDSQSSRRARLAIAAKMPGRISIAATSFRRNPDVVAEILLRANGKCERCLQPAPFIRASDGTPCLEVHHHVTLASGGEDTIENAIALCPNCHRAAHYA